MVTQAKPSDAHGNFDLITKTKLDYTNLEVSKWKSRETGLSVVHLDYEGALCYCSVAYRTSTLTLAIQ